MLGATPLNYYVGLHATKANRDWYTGVHVTYLAQCPGDEPHEIIRARHRPPHQRDGTSRDRILGKDARQRIVTSNPPGNVFREPNHVLCVNEDGIRKPVDAVVRTITNGKHLPNVCERI